MGRRRAREFALQVLYQTDLSGCLGVETSRDSSSALWASQLEDGGVTGSAADSVSQIPHSMRFVTSRLILGLECQHLLLHRLSQAAYRQGPKT